MNTKKLVNGVRTLGVLGHGVGFSSNGQGSGALGAGGIGRHRIGDRPRSGYTRAGGERDPVIMTLGGPGTAVRGGDGHRSRSAEVLKRLVGGIDGIATATATGGRLALATGEAAEHEGL